jgi:molybdate transport repressor ModE-like protein
MHIDIELKTLKIMLTIEQQGSFSKAAKKLYISQPALTQYIKRVESSLSFPLYNRENGKCIPTEPAKILLKEGKVLLEQYDSMLRKVQNIANSNTTNIHLGWPVGYTLHYLNSIMSSVSQLNSTTLVENGFGLSIVPYWFAEKGHKKINYYHIKSNYRTYRIFACVYHRNQVISPELQSFIDCVKNIYGDQNAYMPFDYSTLSEKL